MRPDTPVFNEFNHKREDLDVKADNFAEKMAEQDDRDKKNRAIILL